MVKLYISTKSSFANPTASPNVIHHQVMPITMWRPTKN